MSSYPMDRHARPAIPSSVNDVAALPPSTSPTSMQRSSSDQSKVSKRKGARSVSTLTPAQLARKRANDREAQRAIRARTKEHIERLEAELEELRSERNRDPAIQELLRRNKMLEEELKTLRESVGIPFNGSSPYSAPGALASPRASPYPSNDFTSAASATSAPMPPDYPQGYVSFPNPGAGCETWVTAVPGSVPSNVSSPCSSNADEYAPGPTYLPTSAPNPMAAPPATRGLNPHDGIKMEYEDGNDLGFHPEIQSDGIRSNTATPPTMHAVAQPFLLAQQQHAWGPNSPMYFSQVQHPVY